MKKRDRKPTLQQFMAKEIAKIRTAFRVPMKVTVIVRHPTDMEGEVIFTDDDIDALIDIMQRRRDAVKLAVHAPEDDSATTAQAA